MITLLKSLARSAIHAILLIFLSCTAFPQETYLVTYSHQMEEPGNLEVGVRSVTASPTGGNTFLAQAFELEYGVKAWSTSELYLDSQSTAIESCLFTGLPW